MITYDIYPKYHKCLFKLVHTYVKKSQVDFDELMSEANQGFIKAVDSYDPDKAGFHTHLYTTVSGRLRNYIKTKPVDLPLDDSLLSSFTPNPEQNATFWDLIAGLSAEAKEVVDTVLSYPGELLELVRDMSSNRQDHIHLRRSNLYSFFRSKKWPIDTINACFAEIKTTFN